MNKQTTYTPSGVYEFMTKMITSNDKLMAQGKAPVSLSISGVHGIGKSTICKEVAEDMKRGFFKLNLAQLTEPSELLGFYQKESKMTKEGHEDVWIPESLIPKFYDDGYKYSGETRTIACPPEWVVNLKENSILCLDDFSRGNSLFAQAVMELVNEGQMIGWDLKAKKVQIILNENPDDGSYNTTSLDGAQTDRMFKIHMIWDAKDWAARAEKIGADERLINFVLWAPEFLEKNKKNGLDAEGGISPRMMDKFFNIISTIDDFSTPSAKAEIMAYASTSVGSTFGAHLLKFIDNKLDKLPSVEKLIKEDKLEDAKKSLSQACGMISNPDGESWKSATSAILSLRFVNYVQHNAANLNKADIKQFADLIHHDSFSDGQKVIMVKQTVKLGSNISKELVQDPRFAKMLMSK